MKKEASLVTQALEASRSQEKQNADVSTSRTRTISSCLTPAKLVRKFYFKVDRNSLLHTTWFNRACRNFLCRSFYFPEKPCCAQPICTGASAQHGAIHFEGTLLVLVNQNSLIKSLCLSVAFQFSILQVIQQLRDEVAGLKSRVEPSKVREAPPYWLRSFPFFST